MITEEMVKHSLIGCKETFDVRLAGLTYEAIDVISRVLAGELNAALIAADKEWARKQPHTAQ
jgi:hypothetical protein